MKYYLGITDDSFHYYKNQTPKMKAETRAKIKHDFNVLMKAGKDKAIAISWLAGKWLCSIKVVTLAINKINI